jgi:urease accessory protein
MLRARTFIRAEDLAADGGRTAPFDLAVLAHDERHLRRKLIRLTRGDGILVDLPEAVMLRHGDVLVLEDGRHAGIASASEALLEVRGRDALHLAELAWHIGNRHLSARIEAARILILRDHVLRAMLEGLGAVVSDVVEPFEPLGGAYSATAHSHPGPGHSRAPAGGHQHHHDDHDADDGAGR